MSITLAGQSPHKTAPDGFPEANILVGSLVVMAVLWGLFMPASPKSAADVAYEARRQRLRDIAVVNDFPIDARMSWDSCGRYGPGTGSCMASENDLREQAADLWRKADKYLRLRCIAGSDSAPGPTGYVYACLRASPHVDRPTD